MFVSLRVALARACGNARILFGPPLGSGLRSGMEQKRDIVWLKKQLLAAYSALQSVEPITQMAEIIAKTTLPVQVGERSDPLS